MSDISGFGTVVTIKASNTFPNGVPISDFADDSDPIDSPALTIAETAMGLNGTLISWSNANPVPLTINIIPGSDSDENLKIIGDSNRPSRNRSSARDIITLTVVYPDGQTAVFKGGKMIDYVPTKSIASSGRMKTKPYNFMFETVD